MMEKTPSIGLDSETDSRPGANDEPSSGWFRSMLLLGVGIVSFLLVCAVLRSIRPWPADYSVTLKLRYYAEHQGDFDAVFVGSSAIFRHFVPEVIDARLAELGHPLRTFNFGGPGTRDFETDHLLREVLSMGHGNLKYVFIEPSLWNPNLHESNKFAERTINWHSAQQTKVALEACFLTASPEPWASLSLALDHLRLFLWRSCNYGLGTQWASMIGTNIDFPMTMEQIVKHKGYQSLESLGTPEVLRRRQRLLNNVKQYQRQLERMKSEKNANPAQIPFHDRALNDQVELIRSSGAVPIYVVGPWAKATPRLDQLYERGMLPNYFPFNDPESYPDLYRIDLRYDKNHLSEEGARAFSKIFADSFHEYLKDHSEH